MKSIPALLLAHMQGSVTTLCTMWKITLTNGTVKTFTDLDQDVVYGGLTYLASTGYTASAVDSSSQLNPDNMELEGFLQSPTITDADIHSGIWDYAEILVFEVNYVDPTMGANILRSGTLGEVKGGRSKFTVEIRGLMQAYSRTIVRLTTKECNADLGDTRCKIVLSAWTVAGTVSSVATNRTITTTGFTQAAQWFTGGKLTFTSGLNIGLSMEVKQSTGNVLELHEKMPFAIAAGDTFSVYAGCSKRFEEDCRVKFNNVVNFRGFPHLPGHSIYKPGGVT